MESFNVVVDDVSAEITMRVLEKLPESVPSSEEDSQEQNDEEDREHSHSKSKEPSSRVTKNHPRENMLGESDESMRLKKRVINQVSFLCYLSQVEPKKVEEALQDEI